MAASTVICFVVGIANPLNLFSTPGTRFSIAPVNCHTFTKRCHVFRKANLCFGASIVLYNAFLNDIATEDQRDKVSSRGFAL